MTEPGLTVKPSFWGELFTAPRLISFAICLAGGGMWIQSQRSNIEQLRERITVLEQRMNSADENNASIYMRRDNLSYELKEIRDELTRLRAQVEGVRKDLR